MKFLVPTLVLAALVFTSHTAPAQMIKGQEVNGRITPPPSATPDAAKPQAKQPPTGVLAKDEKGKNPSNTFSTSDSQIFLVWKDATPSPGDQVRVVWVGEAVEGISKNKKLSEGSQTIPKAGAVSANFFLKAPKGGLPAGKYRADLYDGKKLAQSLKFTVSK